MQFRFLLPAIIITGILLLFSVIPDNLLYNINWALLSVFVIVLALIAFFRRFERGNATAKDIAFIATMASLAAVSRVAFAPIAGVQPATFIIMITGYVFGAQTGFLVGAVAAFASNFFLGHGPWTPWQMFSWGLCGACAALLGTGDSSFRLYPFTVLAALWGYIFGWVMNVWHWMGFVYPLTFKTFIMTYAASFPFDTMHALGNVVFSLMLGKSFFQVLSRFKKKLTYTRIKLREQNCK